MTTATFTQQPDANAPFTSPHGYTITHVYQFQNDDEDSNTGQYTLSTDVDWWEEIPRVIESMMTYPEGAGFTLSLTVTARGN